MKKITLTILSIILMSAAFGQIVHTKTDDNKPKMDNVVKPLIVLKVDEKTVTVENKDENGLILEDIDVNQIISLEVLKESNAVAKYGEEARNGVIIIHLRDFSSLPDRTKKLFDKPDKVKKEG